jgi:hypothetical protein
MKREDNNSKRRMQNVKFRNLEEFLDYLPPDELRLTTVLRTLVLDCIPNVKEKLSFNVPYYKVHKNICFIWPASVLWGNRKTYEGVRFGILNGHLIQDEINYFDRGDRKYVSWKDISSISDHDIDLLKSFIFEAALIDQEHYRNRK